tara:strand:- start:1425 stop:1718 length:294 start_codon:yes stop_codon:yes gene_type:complete
MKYKDILINIHKIKKLRTEFIEDFDIQYDIVNRSLTEALNNKKLNSIRLHKYLTNNKKLGKVNTARYLESIGLNETIKISELNTDLIVKIATYCSEE